MTFPHRHPPTARNGRLAKANAVAHISPYHAPGFYADALARGQHRAIVGGRWDETANIQFELLLNLGLRHDHKVLDIGCGALRTAARLVPWLAPGHYWGTDRSLDLMRHGYRTELPAIDRARLPIGQLVADEDFSFPGIPADRDFIIALAVFTHLPLNHLRRALLQIAQGFPQLEQFVFTVFLALDAAALTSPWRQADGVVTHDCRPPYHLLAADLHHFAAQAGLRLTLRPDRLPRGQVAVIAKRV